jgi:hypothetical protein
VRALEVPIASCMNGTQALELSIRAALAAQRRLLDEALEEARTGARWRQEFRAEQERGRTLPPITSSSDRAGNAPRGSLPIAG